MVRFNLYGKLHSSPAALDPTWAEGVRRRSVWVLSPAGFAYRRQAPADECAMDKGAVGKNKGGDTTTRTGIETAGSGKDLG
eukprot:scaffold10805_cov56-Phaeocystis_antarctica.AAC.1